MALTAIPRVKNAILSTLEEAEALDGVTVAKGKEPTDPEYVWIVKGKATREFAAVGGRPPLNEDIDVTLRIVAVDGDDIESEDRAYELATAVEEALRDNDNLGDNVLFQRVRELEDGQLLFDQAWGFHVLMTVTAKARI